MRRRRPGGGRGGRGARARAPPAHRPARQQRRRPARGRASSTAAPERIERVDPRQLPGRRVDDARVPARARHAGSHVVNVVSVAGTVAVGPYSASKHAQLAFSRSLAVELAPRGITVHTVNPGFVETAGFPQRERLGPLAEPARRRPAARRRAPARRGRARAARDRRPALVPPGGLGAGARARASRMHAARETPRTRVSTYQPIVGPVGGERCAPCSRCGPSQPARSR